MKVFINGRIINGSAEEIVAQLADNVYPGILEPKANVETYLEWQESNISRHWKPTRFEGNTLEERCQKCLNVLETLDMIAILKGDEIDG